MPQNLTTVSPKRALVFSRNCWMRADRRSKPNSIKCSEQVADAPNVSASGNLAGSRKVKKIGPRFFLDEFLRITTSVHRSPTILACADEVIK